MTKREVIEAVVQHHPRYTRRDVEQMVETVFASMTAALAAGDRIELRGFGSFTVKQRTARVRRNPRTGAHVTVAAKNIPIFKVSKVLRARVAGTRPAAHTRAVAKDQHAECEENASVVDNV